MTRELSLLGFASARLLRGASLRGARRVARAELADGDAGTPSGAEPDARGGAVLARSVSDASRGSTAATRRFFAARRFAVRSVKMPSSSEEDVPEPSSPTARGWAPRATSDLKGGRAGGGTATREGGREAAAGAATSSSLSSRHITSVMLVRDALPCDATRGAPERV